MLDHEREARCARIMSPLDRYEPGYATDFPVYSPPPEEYPMTWTDKRINEVGYGYNLDCGGYAFERTEMPGLEHSLILDSGLNYVLPYAGDSVREHDVWMVAFDVGEWQDGTLPEETTDPDGDTLVCIARWHTFESEQECGCHGNPTEDGGFEFSGDPSDQPYPECPRCHGDGFITSDGGQWAAYAYRYHCIAARHAARSTR